MVFRNVRLSCPIPKKSIISLVALLAMFLCWTPAQSQEVAIKTNVLYDATATINLGVEVQVAPRWSLDLSGNLNAWTLPDEKRWKHWFLQPEARYWICEAFSGHFFALHALGGQFNVGHLSFARDILGIHFSELKDHRYQGWFTGVGVGYGYSWILSKHWNIEAEIGLGWLYGHYDVYNCGNPDKKVGKSHKNLFSPTKAAVNIEYVF